MTTVGPMGRLGAWTADHFRAVLIAWLVLAVGLGVLAPRVEHALSGAGWEATGSQSVQARTLIDENFGGQSSAALMVVVHSPSAKVGDPAFAATVDRAAVILREDPRVASVALPRAGFSISQDGHTAIVSAGAKGTTTEMVAAADELKGKLEGRRDGGGSGEPHRRLGHVVGLQRGQPQRDDEVGADLMARHAHHPDAGVRLARRGRAFR